MAKSKRKTRKKTKKVDFLQPIDIDKIGSDDDPCFGKLYDLSTPECKRCGDSELCGVVFAQTLNKTRKKIEKKTKFKDIELSKEDKSIENWVKQKLKKGMKSFKIIKKGMELFDVDKKTMKTLVKKHKK